MAPVNVANALHLENWIKRRRPHEDRAQHTGRHMFPLTCRIPASLSVRFGRPLRPHCPSSCLSREFRDPSFREGLLQTLSSHETFRYLTHALHSHTEERWPAAWRLFSAVGQEQQTQDPTAEPLTKVLPTLRVFNTMSRTKETFQPLHPPRVTLYVCGVTVYDYSHLGHARAYVSFDVLYRLLCALGYDVLYVRNFTDVDDKIIRRAQEIGQSAEDVAERFITEFHKDMKALGCAAPAEEPRATEYISQMIRMIQRIIDNGHGYESGGDVFFDTESLEGYGRLSKRSAEDNRAGERIAIDTRKRSPADFALWKSAKEGEPSWESPWGLGRPGWHIECSAMIRERIGPTVDIHGGGSDLVFPHHENELAQSQAAVEPCEKDLLLNGTDFVRYWMHNGFVTIDEEKMSKSLGNFFTIREVLEKFHPLALRWMLLSTQYRQQLNYSEQLIQEATSNIYYLCQTLADALKETQWHPAEQHMTLEALCESSDIVKAFIEALSDDVNSAAALAGIYGHLKVLNELMHTKKGRKDKARMTKLTQGCRDILCCLSVLGFELDLPEQVIREMKALALKRAEISEAEVLGWIQRRDQARKEKDYTKADALRTELQEKGILMCDSAQGTTWRPA